MSSVLHKEVYYLLKALSISTEHFRTNVFWGTKILNNTPKAHNSWT